MRELWIMLRMVANNKNKQQQEPQQQQQEGFYRLIHKTYQSMREVVNRTEAPVIMQQFGDEMAGRIKLPADASDPLSLVWIYAHVAKLSGYNSTGCWDADFSRVIIHDFITF